MLSVMWIGTRSLCSWLQFADSVSVRFPWLTYIWLLIDGGIGETRIVLDLGYCEYRISWFIICK